MFAAEDTPKLSGDISEPDRDASEKEIAVDEGS